MSPTRQNDADATDASVDRHAAALRAGTWFRDLPAGMQTRMLGTARSRRLEIGQRLFARGDRSDGLYCVLEGAMRLTRTQSGGQEALFAVLAPVQWFGELALIDGGARSLDAWADEPTLLLHVPQAPMLAILRELPLGWPAIGSLLARRTRHAFDAIEEAAALPAIGRVARRLLVIANGYGDHEHPQRTVRVPQERLAQMLALSRQTVNRALKQLEAQGAIRLTRGGTELLDLERLRDIAQ